jgi:protein MpaA
MTDGCPIETMATTITESHPTPGKSHFALLVNLVIMWIVTGYALFLFIPTPSFAGPAAEKALQGYLAELEKRGAAYKWTDIDPARIPWQYHRTTNRKRPLIFVQFGNVKNNCTLFLGGVHGDEIPTVYLLLKMANYIHDHPSQFRDKCIVIAPLVNPDGFFAQRPRRVNANGVDINRNFPTRDWSARALSQWKGRYSRSSRYNPGKRAASEPETGFQMALIKRFKPQKILSIHSPLGLYDYDGPSSDLDSFEQWIDIISRETNHPMKRYGYFPGSLGNYAGHERNIFTLTLELRTSNPGKGREYFSKFQPMIMKFLDLPIDARPPYPRIVRSTKAS